MPEKDKITVHREDLQPHYEHYLPIVRFYWHRVMAGIVSQIEAKKNELILDFGCGTQRLKHYLPKHAIIGYDIITEYSDINDYKSLRPHTIVCSHVLEHLEISQLQDLITDFMGMRQKFLITAQPTENWLSRISNLLGRPQCITNKLKAIDHISDIKDIHDRLSKSYDLKKRKGILTMTSVSKWAPK